MWCTEYYWFCSKFLISFSFGKRFFHRSSAHGILLQKLGAVHYWTQRCPLQKNFTADVLWLVSFPLPCKFCRHERIISVLRCKFGKANIAIFMYVCTCTNERAFTVNTVSTLRLRTHSVNFIKEHQKKPWNYHKTTTAGFAQRVEWGTDLPTYRCSTETQVCCSQKQPTVTTYDSASTTNDATCVFYNFS